MDHQQDQDHERRGYTDAWIVQDRLRHILPTDSMFCRAQRRVIALLQSIALGQASAPVQSDAMAPRS